MIYQGDDLSWRLECSNIGRIRNAINKHIYIPHKCGIGYYQICTSINGTRRNIKIHKAVAETFIENPNKFPCINHIDGNKENNNMNNLEWCTHKQNYEHAIKLGLINKDIKNLQKYNLPDTKGEKNGLSKLKNEDIIYIRKHYIPKQKGEKCNRQQLADMFNVSPQLIYKIYKREIWKHIQ